MLIEEIERLCNPKHSNCQLDNEYSKLTQRYLRKHWLLFINWFKNKNTQSFFNTDIHTYKNTVLKQYENKEISYIYLKNCFFALNCLSRYLTIGYFKKFLDFSCIVFDNNKGKIFTDYLATCQALSNYTYRSIEIHLCILYTELIANDKWLDDIDFNFINKLVSELNARSSHYRSVFRSHIRQFFRWCYEKNITQKDISLYVVREKNVPSQKIPSSFNINECKQILKSIDRTSKIGKRDYSVLLCLAVYGWRSGDVCNLKLSDIDWRKNKISFFQQKTKKVVEFPLVAIVGNALVDYLKNSRPTTSEDYVFVYLSKKNCGKQISVSKLYKILSKYIRKIRLENIFQRKHGPHAFRFSLAIELVNRGTPIDMVKSMLGHSSQKTTFNYIRIDINKLKICALDMPECISQYYADLEVKNV